MWRQVFARSSSYVDNWTTLTIKGGGGTFVVDENALVGGGIPYRDSGSRNSLVQNRFVVWRCLNAQVIEIAEYSLDAQLKSAGLRIEIKDDVVLPGGVVVAETRDAVLLLLAMASSVHRFKFPHPTRTPNADPTFAGGSSPVYLSVFSSVASRTYDYVMRKSGDGGVSRLSASCWAMQSGEAWFSRGSANGSLHVVHLPVVVRDEIVEFVLKESSVIQRMWNDIVSRAIRFSGSSSDAVVDIRFHVLGGDLLVFAISQDLKLRIWSIQDRNLLKTMDFGSLHETSTQDAQARIAVAQGTRNSTLSLAVNVSSESKSAIYLCTFAMENKIAQLAISREVSIDEDPILSWDLSSTLLVTLQGGNSSTVRRIPFRGPLSVVELHSGIPDQIDVGLTEDVNKIYLDSLFSGRRFSRETLLRALQLWRASPDTLRDLTDDYVRNLVSKTLEDHVYESAGVQEMESDEYRDLQISSWTQFYRTCRDYQMEEDASVGIFRDNSTGMISIVTASSVSFLKLVDVLERCMASPSNPSLEVATSSKEIRNIEFVFKCVNSLLSIMSSRQLNFDISSPDLTVRQQAEEIAFAIASQRSGFDSPEANLLSRLLTVRFETSLLSCLMDLLQPTALGDVSEDSSLQLACSHLYSSPLGLVVLSGSFAQLSSARQDFSLGLLVYCTLLLNFSSEIGLGLGTVFFLRSEAIPRLEYLATGYATLSWMANQKPMQSADSLDGHVRRLSALNLSSVSTAVQDDCLSMLEVYLSNSGGQRFHSDLASDSAWGPALHSVPCQYWTFGLPAAFQTLTNHIWPERQVFFGEFLLANGQYAHLEKFVSFCRQMKSPCPGTLLFLESQCLIQFRNYREAYSCVIKAANSLDEPFFKRTLGLSEDDEDDVDEYHLRVQYYLKALQIFEEIPASNLIVDLASKVISELNVDDPNAAIFWSSKFKHLLKEEDIDRAYAALVSNPDLKRRKDYLRHFVMVLCEKGLKKELCSFPYVGLLDQVSKVLVSRARGADLALNNFYDILYSFHTLKGNFRQAAFFMCECASRLALECPGIDSLQKQAECYLAALNSLRLVNKKHAWIVRPSQWEGIALKRYQRRSKRKRGQDPLDDGDQTRVKVLSVHQLALEYTLILSNLQLLECCPDSIDPNAPCLSPDETFSVLIQKGCFDVSLKLARSFHLPRKPIFEALAMRCAQKSTETSTADWAWLSYNETSKKLTKVGSFSEQAWLFLREYEKIAKSCGHNVLSIFYPSVTNILLSLGSDLPEWFVQSYTEFFPSQLIHIYLQYGMADDALKVTRACLHTENDIDVEDDGGRRIWTPITAVDNLLPIFEDMSDVLSKRWVDCAQDDS
ncbi:nuclear pore complex protein Nup160-like [Oscarella lobularis]|uniref:nuclear pore complex protein Nup160-like n=1 Tax=Oscarella lobularis TaxID=121494 RepID=UPI0033131D70